MENVQRKKLTSKVAEREILIHKGKLDNSIPDYFNDVYVLDVYAWPQDRIQREYWRYS